MHLSHKIELNPTKLQEEYFTKACGVSRFTYNWALSKCQEHYKATGKTPSLSKLIKEFNVLKRSEFPWIYETHKDANQQAFSDLQDAYNKFFKHLSDLPKRKKKYKKDSFYVSNDRLTIKDKYVVLPRIGKVKIYESLRFDGKIMSGRVKRHGDKWFIAISVDVGDYAKKRINDNTVGIDLGIKTTLVCSNGESFQAPRPLKNNLKKLRRLSKSVSRKVKGSENCKKAGKKVAKLHYKISCIRKDWLNKITTNLCRENQAIVIEDLAVKNLMKNHKLARSFSDVSFGEFRRQLMYKSLIYNTEIIIADRFFPSSKLCCFCGHKKDDLTLKDRVYHCESCGATIDRDLNASLNLVKLAFK